MHWHCLPFAELGVQRLYDALALRSEVFVVEQQCMYQDVDGLDDRCLHLLGWQGEALHAYARLLPPGLKGPRPVIGRVIVAPAARGAGLGHELVERAVDAGELVGGDRIGRALAQALHADGWHVLIHCRGLSARGEVKGLRGVRGAVRRLLGTVHRVLEADGPAEQADRRDRPGVRRGV